MSNQQTLKQNVSFAGIGLHSGNRVNMTFLPASANSGIRFRRVDLEGKPEIEARIENVTETNRSGSLFSLVVNLRQKTFKTGPVSYAGLRTTFANSCKQVLRFIA